ncbi:MAG TPA: Hpt domain-containing protein, partial [Lysobacter sp.]|nr:Hpt domain-containing protein [Lysobacter sp.]
MVGATEVGDFAWSFEDLLNRLIEEKIRFSEPLAEALRLAVAALGGLRARMLGEDSPLSETSINALKGFARQLSSGAQPALESLQAALPETLFAPAVADTAEAQGAEQPDASLGELLESGSGMDPTLRQLMVSEIGGYLSELECLVDDLSKGANTAVEAGLVRAVHTLAGTLSMAPLGQEAEVARALERYLDNRLKSDRPVTGQALRTVQTCLHRFHQRLGVLEDGHAVSYPLDDERLLAELAGLAGLEDSAPVAQASAQDDAAELQCGKPAVPHVAAGEDFDDQGDAPIGEGLAAEQPTRLQIEDGSIIAIFLEEAVEVLERCDTLLNTWRDKLSDRKLVQNLQREIHTFKGGARMAGLEGLGELSHSMETLLEHIAGNRLEATVAAVQALEEGCDNLNLFVEQLQSGRLPRTDGALARFDKKVKALRLPQAEQQAEQQNEPLHEAPARPAAPRQLEREEPERAETSVAAAKPAPKPRDESRANETAADETLPPAKPPAARPQEGAPAARADAVARPGAAPPERRKPIRREPVREFREIEDRPAAASDESAPGAQIRVAADLMDKLV